jgi:hypothetical protein
VLPFFQGEKDYPAAPGRRRSTQTEEENQPAAARPRSLCTSSDRGTKIGGRQAGLDTNQDRFKIINMRPNAQRASIRIEVLDLKSCHRSDVAR